MLRQYIQVRVLIVFVSLGMLIASLPTCASGATLHAIIVGDTLDPQIGDSVLVDLKNISALAKAIAENTGLQLNEQDLVKGRSKRSVLDATINGLRVTSADVILFYFSGHGERAESQESPLPGLILNSTILNKYGKPGIKEATVQFRDVVEALASQRPRLLLALCDACNVYGQIFQPDDFAQKKATRKSIPASYRRLFLEQQGIILASSSSPGEDSVATPDGGVFTLQFLNFLEQAMATDDPSWEQIMDLSNTPIRISSNKQRPQSWVKITAATSQESETSSSGDLGTNMPAPTPQPEHPAPGNLLRNGDFTQGTAGWNLNGSNWAVYRGNDGLPFLATNDDLRKSQGPSIFQDVNGLAAGRTYTFEAEIVSPFPGRNITMAIWELGGGPSVNSTQMADGNSAWEQFSVAHTKQRENSTLRVEIYYEVIDQPADIWIRNARLR
jgi:hypothetical protein